MVNFQPQREMAYQELKIGKDETKHLVILLPSWANYGTRGVWGAALILTFRRGWIIAC